MAPIKKRERDSMSAPSPIAPATAAAAAVTPPTSTTPSTAAPAASAIAVAEAKKEQELFLQAFEKPTQIYRYLRNRHCAYPVFLNRTLAYMRHRFSRNHKSRASFKIDGMLEACMSDTETKSQEFLHVIYNGIFDTTGCSDQWWNPGDAVSIDAVLYRIVKNKRKDSATDMQEIWRNSTNVIYNPHEDTERCSVINIPFQSLMPQCDQNSTYKLHFYIQVSNYNIKTLKEKVTEDGPVPGSSGRPELPKQFGCELTIYEKIFGHTPDGAYEAVIQEIFSQNKILSPKKRFWETMPDDCAPLALKLDLFNREAVLKFYLYWGPNDFSILDAKKLIEQEFMDYPMTNGNGHANGTESNGSSSESMELASDEAAAPTMNHNNNCIKGNGDTNAAKGEKIQIVYNFLYNNNTCQQTEYTHEVICPWCNIDCVRLLSLLKHLKLCHGRFNFNFQPAVNGARIDVTINDSYDGSYSGSPYDLAGPSGSVFARTCGPVRRTTVTNLLVCRPRRQKPGMDEFMELEEEDVSNQRSYLTGHNRLYHHTETCLPVHPKELDIDSEGESDPQWLRQKTIQMIDEFSDVNEGEKELMKLWNLHVMKHGFVGDCQLPLACEMFLEANGRDIVKKNLYNNFILHMSSLFDYGLVSPESVHKTVQKLQDILSKFPEGQEMVTKYHETQMKYWLEVGMHKQEWQRSKPPLKQHDIFRTKGQNDDSSGSNLNSDKCMHPPKKRTASAVKQAGLLPNKKLNGAIGKFEEARSPAKKSSTDDNYNLSVRGKRNSTSCTPPNSATKQQRCDSECRPQPEKRRLSMKDAVEPAAKRDRRNSNANQQTANTKQQPANNTTAATRALLTRRSSLASTQPNRKSTSYLATKRQSNMRRSLNVTGGSHSSPRKTVGRNDKAISSISAPKTRKRLSVGGSAARWEKR